MLTDKHDKLQYFSSAAGYRDLAASLQKHTQSQPGSTTRPKSHLMVSVAIQKLMSTNIRLLFRLPLRNLISPNLQMGDRNPNHYTGTQTIISWGLHMFFNKTRDKLNPHDLVYNLDSNEYLSMSCAIRVKTSQFVLAPLLFSFG